MATQFGLADVSSYCREMIDSWSLVRTSSGPSFFTSWEILMESCSWCNWTFGFQWLGGNWNPRKRGYLWAQADACAMTSEFGQSSFELYIFEAFLVIDNLVEKCKILCPVELAWIFHSMPLLNSEYLSSDFLILKSLVCLCLDGFLRFWPLSQDPQLCLELLEFHFAVAAQMISSVSLLSYFFVNCP